MYRSGQISMALDREVGFCDFLDLAPGDFPHLFFIRRAAPLDDPHGLLDQDCGRRSFSDKRERTIRVNGDHHRDNHSRLRLGSRVKYLTELHDIYAVLTERGSNRGRRGCNYPAGIWSFIIPVIFLP